MSKSQFLMYTFLVVVLSLVMHLCFLWSTPMDVDEPVYVNITSNVVEDGYPNLSFDGTEGNWFASHPPFQFYVWSFTRIFGATNTSLLRLFSSLIATAVVALSMWMTYRMSANKLATLIVGLLLATDGWFNYTSLLVKIDTTAAFIGAAGIYIFYISQKRENLSVSIVAGIILGFAAVYKHVAMIYPAAVVVHWLLVRKNHKLHITTGIAAGSVILLYLSGMTIFVGDPFINATASQVRRSLGLVESRGLNFGPSEIVLALAQTYWAFLGSVTALVFGGVIILRFFFTVPFKRFHYDLVSQYSVLFAWTITAGLVLAGVKLRNPHYLVYLIIPTTMLVGIQVALLFDRGGVYKKLAYVFVGIVLVLNTVSVLIRATSFSAVDALAETSEFLATLPEDQIFLSEEWVCADTTQLCIPFKDIDEVIENDIDVGYIIIYSTLTHSPPDNQAFHELVSTGETVLTIIGWKENIIVLRLE